MLLRSWKTLLASLYYLFVICVTDFEQQLFLKSCNIVISKRAAIYPDIPTFVLQFSSASSIDRTAIHLFKVQKQPLRNVLRKRCSENMQQIYRGTPIPKCDFNKVALQLENSIWNLLQVNNKDLIVQIWVIFLKLPLSFIIIIIGITIVVRRQSAKRQVKTSREALKENFWSYYDLFSLSNEKIFTIKAVLELSLVSLTLRACTVF